MMLGTSLMLAAALTAQSADTADKARIAYLKCLRGYLYESVQKKITDVEFGMGVASACSTEQTAFHDALIALDRADGIKLADARENADLQVADYIDNFKEKFADYIASGTQPSKD